MKIGLDIDDVLAEFVPRFRRECRELFGIPEQDIEPTDWGWSNFGLSDAEINAVWRKINNTHNFHESLDRKEDAYGLSYIQGRNTLFFLTTRRQTKGDPVEVQTYRWLQAKFEIAHPTVLVSAKKPELAAALELDVFIDDKPETCEAVKLARPECQVFLRNSSHNVSHKESEGIIRVGSFSEFRKLSGA